MGSNSKTARVAGWLYLVTVVTGIFSLIYVPSHINGHGDASKTVANILAFETLFRGAIAAGAIGYTAFLILPPGAVQATQSSEQSSGCADGGVSRGVRPHLLCGASQSARYSVHPRWG